MTLPPIPETFRWSEESWGPALRCCPLGLLAPHLFTTRALMLSAPEGWQPVAQAMDVQQVFTVTQVHGRAVIALKAGRELPSGRVEADVLLSDRADVAIAVKAADCVPLLLADARTGAVAAVHAGWRGTAAGAATTAVEAMRDEFGSRASDLVAAIGPCIGVCCYEVGTEVVDAFARAGYARWLVDRWFLAPPPRRGERERPKLRLDLPGANRDQLVLAGVPEDSIHLAGLCTAMQLEVLTSYRAEKEHAARLAGVIRSRHPTERMA